jgi:hypothetical protein
MRIQNCRNYITCTVIIYIPITSPIYKPDASLNRHCNIGFEGPLMHWTTTRMHERRNQIMTKKERAVAHIVRKLNYSMIVSERFTQNWRKLQRLSHLLVSRSEWWIACCLMSAKHWYWNGLNNWKVKFWKKLLAEKENAYYKHMLRNNKMMRSYNTFGGIREVNYIGRVPKRRECQQASKLKISSPKEAIYDVHFLSKEMIW